MLLVWQCFGGHCSRHGYIIYVQIIHLTLFRFCNEVIGTSVVLVSEINVTRFCSKFFRTAVPSLRFVDNH